MKFKKQLMTMALALVLFLTTIIVPKSIAYAEENLYLDETDPSNYALTTNNIDNGDNLLLLRDKYEVIHALIYIDHSSIDALYRELSIAYGGSDTDIKSDYITIELYKYYNGKLTMADKDYWNLADIDEDVLSVTIDKSLFNQQYLYIRAGVSDSVDGTTYDDVTLFKIENPFYVKDVSGHWAEASIRDFITKGYVGGYSDGTFRPNNFITRGEFVTILNKTFGITTTSGKIFNDTKTHWAKNEIDKAVTNGVCNGKSDTEFKPNDPITREEAAVMISNYKKLSDTNYDKINQYKDKGQVSNWAKNSVEGLIENGFMGGYSDGTFRPKGKITRAEAVVTLSRVK